MTRNEAAAPATPNLDATQPTASPGISGDRVRPRPTPHPRTALAAERDRSGLHSSSGLTTEHLAPNLLGRIQLVNQSTTDMFSASTAELAGLHISELVVSEHLSMLETMLRRASASDDPARREFSELRGVGRDRQEFPVEVSAGLVSLPDGDAYVTVWRDVSARRAAREALTRAHELLEATPDFVGWANDDGRIRFINKGGRALVGLGPDDDVTDLRVGSFAPDWAQRLIRDVAIPTAIGHGVWSGESAYLGADGVEIPVSQVVSAHRDEQGRLRYVSTIARDLRERYEIERLKEEFVATVSHELRTPLTGIAGYTELLADCALGELLSEQANAVEVIGRSTARLSALVDDLLTIAVVDEPDRRSGSKPVDLAVVVGAATSLIESNLDPELHRLALSLPDEEVWVEGRASELDKVVTNLLSNAIKFSPEGGLITVRLSMSGAEALLEVTDEGIGVATEDIHRLTDRFFRSSRAIDSAIPGTGLGLAIVSSIVERRFGTLTFEPAPTVGIIASVRLPLVHAQQPIAPEAGS